MAGLLTDLLLLAVVAAFAWGGWRLGFVTSATRFLGGIVALVVAALLARPVSHALTAPFGMEVGLATFLSMVIVGILAYLLASKVVGDAFTYLPEDAYYHRDELLGTVFGGLTGLLWGWIMMITLVLLPSDNAVARGAIESRSGQFLINHNEPVLRWTSDSFERYTQALPKDPDGVLVGRYPRQAPFHDLESVQPSAAAADNLLAGINDQRRQQEARDLLVEATLSSLAEQHALQAVRDRTIATEPTGGTSLASRVERAVPDGQYVRTQGVIVWAQGEARALVGMLRPGGVADIMLDAGWDEVGIGVADAGWFYGKVYVLVFAERALPDGATDDDQTDEPDEQPIDEPAADPFEDAPADEPGDQSTEPAFPDDGGVPANGGDPFAPGPLDDDVDGGF